PLPEPPGPTPKVRGQDRTSFPVGDGPGSEVAHPTRGGGEGPTGRSVVLTGELGVDLDGDLVADEHPAAVHRHLDVDTELLAADLSGGGKARAVQAVGVDGASGELQGQLNGAGVSLDGQVALEDELLALGLEACGLEAELWMLFDVEEVGRADVVVPVAVVGVDRSGVDRGLDGGLHGVVRDGQRGVELLE